MENLTYGIANITIRLSTFSGGSISLNFDGLKDIGVYGNRTSGALNITTSMSYKDFYNNSVWGKNTQNYKYFFNKDWGCAKKI